MSHDPTPAAAPPAECQRLPLPHRPEAEALREARLRLGDSMPLPPALMSRAGPWVKAVRSHPAPFWALDSLLQDYPISSAEGLALMRLAEALLRVPDTETAIALTADQLHRADFGQHLLALASHLLPDAEQPAGLLQRLGARTVVAAAVRAIQLLGHQFVLGQSITAALGQARQQRQQQPGLRFSFDMLGEGARTEADAVRYLQAYRQALAALAADPHQAPGQASGPQERDGLSIKLSALFSRYEPAQRERVLAELLPRVASLVDQAAQADLNLTLDAEESDRLELSLELFESLAAHVARRHPQWRGLGLAVQAYQTRALAVVDEVARLARHHGLRLMVRLVKGAYWDSEIKRAQELGLSGYPVYTRKAHTDLSYLACAAELLAQRDVIYPQFATHNAGTLAALLELAERAGARPGRDFELQRLHGMGEALYRQVQQHGTGPGMPPTPCRVYAPVGEHRDLLAYLVRRLLENGANSSFVHQLADPHWPLDRLLASPLTLAHPGTPEAGPAEGLPLPARLYHPDRAHAPGWDLSCLAERQPIARAIVQAAPAEPAPAPGAPPGDAQAQVDEAMHRLAGAFPAWCATPLAERAAVLRRAGSLLQARGPQTIAMLVHEGRKTWADALAEWREAVDFCDYYAWQAETTLAPRTLPGPTGESNELHLRGRGVFVCISPWNFPLAIFAGQVLAALVAGNTVAAKPVEQTPGIAAAFVALLQEAGLPPDTLALLPGPGDTVGAALVAHPAVAGVCFTGSTAVAKRIQRSLAAGEGPIVPLIAETGGLNTLIVDPSALPEQVVDAVMQSAFRSAGQRCSALRVLCLHEAIAEPVLQMLAGAMAELRPGDPTDWATDVGPLIDAEALAGVQTGVARLAGQGARLVARTPLAAATAAAVPQLFAPVAYEIPALGAVATPGEIFGPVLQILRWGPERARREPGIPADLPTLVAQINALGYGLTLGLQTRIDSRARRVAAQARVGNVYVNRNMVGAVVGVQPFGGEGLSGTGPKAGGPHYLLRFCAEQTLTINTAAAGGNAALLGGEAPGRISLP